jgi:polyhydroxyalkanoate synthesis regulator phasin
MIDLTTQKEAVAKAAKDVSDSTVEFAGKAKDLGMSSAKSATETASEYMDKAMELGGTSADSATDVFKSFMEKAQSLTGKSIEKVSEVKVGEKNVGERAQATVDTVQDKIDVDQIQDQVAKLRDQMEHMLGSWKDSFRPSPTTTQEVSQSPKAEKAPSMSRKQLTAMTKDELLVIARERDLSGRSSMTKSELVKAIVA